MTAPPGRYTIVTNEGGITMTEAALAALMERLNGVMVLAIVSIGLNMLMTGLVIAALIMAVIYFARRSRRGED